MNISKIAYEKYRIHWMLSHGYSLTELFHELELVQEENPDYSIDALFAHWEYGYGFRGEVWACYDEFMESEYLDEEYMKSLLSEFEYEMYSNSKNEV